MNKKDETSEIVLIGMSHKTAPIEIREQFTFDRETLSRFYSLVPSCGIEEVVYLATCNRVELYFTAGDRHHAVEKLTELVEEFTGLSRDDFAPYIYRKNSRDVVLHLLTVASSLDSMVIGENEILGQIKQAYRDSVMHKNSGILLNRLFHQAFNTAKKVRTRTGIAQNPLSIAYIAVEQARKIFGGDLTGRSALLVGAGEMGELILKYLTKDSIGAIIVANRSLHNAETVVERINVNARIIPMSEIAGEAARVDIIITSVACHDYILDSTALNAIVSERGGRPLCVIDIAVPRNVDPDAVNMDGITLCNIDDLKAIADENMKTRLGEVEAALQIVNTDAADLFEWYEGLEMVPMIVRMQQSFEKIREREIEKYRKRRGNDVTEEEMTLVEELTRQIISKILHNPIMAIKENKSLQLQGYHTKEAIKQKIQVIEELFKI